MAGNEERQKRIDDMHRVNLNQTALLVIDMQHAFLDEGASLEVPKGRQVLPNVVTLIGKSREHGIPVMFTEFVYSAAIPCLRGDPFGPQHLPTSSGTSTEFGLPASSCLIGATPGQGVESAETVDQVAPRADELVVQAHTYDKFYGTHLDLALRSRGIGRLIVTGVTTDVCVNSTIIAASTRDYRVTAVTDAMATIHDHIHDACLEIWRNKFARLATTTQIISEIDEAQ